MQGQDQQRPRSPQGRQARVAVHDLPSTFSEHGDVISGCVSRYCGLLTINSILGQLLPETRTLRDNATTSCNTQQKYDSRGTARRQTRYGGTSSSTEHLCGSSCCCGCVASSAETTNFVLCSLFHRPVHLKESLAFVLCSV